MREYKFETLQIHAGSAHIGEQLNSFGEILNRLISIIMFYAVTDAVFYIPFKNYLPSAEKS